MASLSPKKQMSLAEKLQLLDKITTAINDKAGKKIVGRLGADDEIMERLRIKFIPTPSLDLNDALGGGFPRRRTSIVAGMPDSGKTSLLLETIAYNQKQDPNFVAGWLESENSLELDYLVNTFCIDPERFFYIEVDRKDGAETALDRVEAVLGTGAIDIFVINSLRCLVPQSELHKSMREVSVAEQARMNSKMVKKFTSLVAEHETAFVLIQHLTTQIGSLSRDPMVVAGGHAIMYAASIIIDLRKQSIQEADPITKEEGVKIGVSIKKNHCVPDRFPYVKTVYYAIFNEGIEQILTTLDRAIKQGILRKAGSWIYWDNPDGTQRYSWQGKVAYRQFMREHPEVLEELKRLLRGEYEQMNDDEVAEIKADEEIIEQASVEYLAEENGVQVKRGRKKAG